MMAGSISPVRVPIMTPPSGVNPIDVSTETPLSTAVIEAPLPIWQVISLSSSIGRPKILAASLATYSWLVP